MLCDVVEADEAGDIPEIPVAVGVDVSIEEGLNVLWVFGITVVVSVCWPPFDLELLSSDVGSAVPATELVVGVPVDVLTSLPIVDCSEEIV